MRKVLKTIVPEPQRKKLKAMEANWNNSVKNFGTNLVNAVLPDKMRVDLKSAIQVLRKLDYPKHEIFLNVDSDIEFSTRLNSCKKEPEMIHWIETFLKEGDVFYDVGANVGAYSLVASKYFNGNIKVYAFEPSFPNFVQLSKNIFTNHCQDSIIPMQIALSDATALGTFNYSNLIPGGALHAFGQPIDYKGDRFQPVYQQTIFSYRMDDLIDRFQMDSPHHMKMDVDGFEFKILKGAQKILSNPRMKSIIIELDEGDAEANEISTFLKNYGFRFLSKHKYTATDDTGPFSKMYNYIFEKTKNQ